MFHLDGNGGGERRREAAVGTVTNCHEAKTSTGTKIDQAMP